MGGKLRVQPRSWMVQRRAGNQIIEMSRDPHLEEVRLSRLPLFLGQRRFPSLKFSVAPAAGTAVGRMRRKEQRRVVWPNRIPRP
jgi:hypothetical protein